MFWIGDLNYRITEETPDQEVFEMLQNDDIETLRRVVQYQCVPENVLSAITRCAGVSGIMGRACTTVCDRCD